MIRCDKSAEDGRSKVEFVIKLGAESLDLASQLQKAEKQYRKIQQVKGSSLNIAKKSLLNKEKKG